MSLVDDLGHLKAGDDLAVTFAIDYEKVSHEQFGDRIKIIAEISGQIIIFDFSSQTLVANYPIAAASNGLIKSSEDLQLESEKLLSSLYLGDEATDGILQLAAKKLSLIKPERKIGLRFQIKEFNFSETTLMLVPETVNINAEMQYLGQYVSAQLSHQHNVSVLPFVKGYAINNTMAGRFADGAIYNLSLPPPDYTFQFDFMNAKSQIFNEDDLLFACQLNMQFTQAITNKQYINTTLYYGIPKLVAKNQKNIDEWAAYVDCLEVFVDELISQLARPDKKWLKQHGGDNQTSVQFKTKKGLFNG